MIFCIIVILFYNYIMFNIGFLRDILYIVLYYFLIGMVGYFIFILVFLGVCNSILN